MKIHAEAKEVEKLLKKNGGPLATRAAAVISELRKYLPKETRGQIHPHHEAIVLLFQSRLNKSIRDSKEIRAFKAIEKLITSDDLDNLKRFYKQSDPKQYHKQLSRRKATPTTLMRSWVEQCDLAAEWCRQNPPAPKPGATKYPEPDGWQQHAPGRLGDFSWQMLSRQYPDIAKQLSESLQPNCTSLEKDN